MRFLKIVKYEIFNIYMYSSVYCEVSIKITAYNFVSTDSGRGKCIILLSIDN